MKKISFIGAFLISISLYAQKTIIVNGGRFGNQAENVSVVAYDGITNTYSTIDTIQTQSVQDILIDGNFAFVAAQDSIIKYDLNTEQRVAAAAFNGPSTKTFGLSQNKLLVGNWYGKSSYNLYIYDANNLNLLDSVAAFDKGAKSILIHNGFAYITQNSQTSNFQDTLGSIIRLDLSNNSITDTISVAGYSGDMGELVMNPTSTGLYSFNSASNTVTSVDFNALSSASNTNLTYDLNISNASQWSLSRTGDSIFLRTNVSGSNRIAIVNMNNFSMINSNVVDTVITAFSYDVINLKLFVTQTNFFSYSLGKIYDRTGTGPWSLAGPLNVASSPEVIRMYYPVSVGFEELVAENLVDFYPNPVGNQLFINSEDNGRIRIFNTSGSLVLETTLNRGQNSLNLQSLEKGSYVITFIGEKGMSSELLIKQ